MTDSDWQGYVRKLARIDRRAGDMMQAWIDAHGTDDREALIEYAHALATRYGEAGAALACEMYDAQAAAQGAAVPPAEPAATATEDETARAVLGALKDKQSVPDAVSRLTKQAGADTTLKNASRDGSQFAWVPHGGETCAFCIMLASNGWRRMSRKALKGGHAEHIHAHCQCTYAVRFGNEGNIPGYDPDKYLAMYRGAEGDTWQEKVNSLRRADYAERREEINAQKRAAYAARQGSTDGAGRGLWLPDMQIGKSVGAKAANYDILDPDSGEYYNFVEGTRIQDAQVFAGYGTRHPLQEDVANGLAEQLGGEPRKWQHCKGRGHIDVGGEDIEAEVHWFQEDTAGKHKFKVKKWLDDES